MKSNDLIEGRYNFNLYEQRILLKLCSMISFKDEAFKDYIFNVSDFSNEFGFNVNYTELRKVVTGLVKKTISIERGRGRRKSWIVFNILSYAELIPNEGKLHLRFDPAMSPYLLHLKKRFTSYQLKYVANLVKTHSLRLYELLKQYEKIGSRTISTENMIKYFKLNAEGYGVYGNLKMGILTPCINEINEKTDIDVSFEDIKEGRKVVKIKFDVNRNQKLIEQKKEKKKPKESDGQIFVDEHGDLVTEKEFTNKFMIELENAEMKESNRRIDAPYQKKINSIKKAIKIQGLKYIHDMYWKAIDHGTVDHINYYYKKILPLCKIE